MTVTLNILEIGARGDGVALEEGHRYFVPFTLPGEIVEAEPRDKRGEGIVADLKEILAPSRHREPAPCKHFGTCGGCALQHWRRDIYAGWKNELIARALEQRGVMAPAFEPALAGLPNERRRADFVVRRQGRKALAGFHERASPQVVDVQECFVATPKLVAVLPPLRSVLAGILPEGGSADAIVNDTDAGLDVLVRPHKRFTLSLEANQKLVAFAESADLARLSWGDRATAEPLVTRRSPRLTFGEVALEPPPGAFLQATRRSEQAMRDAVASWTGDAKRVADLFAGMGTLTVGRPWRATLYESDKPSIAAVEAAGRRLGSGKLTAVHRDLFRNPLMTAELGAFDAAVLDPPRAGAVAQTAELAKSKVPQIVYGSCDPGSFARDARVLQDGGYRLEKLMPIDQFLWSPHVELIALFARAPLSSAKK